jgi:hypothetical protein
MTGTIATCAGESQRTHGGVRPFLDAGGAAASTSRRAASRRHAIAGVRPASEAEIRDAGEQFLVHVFGASWAPDPDAADTLWSVLRTPIDSAWIEKRIERLKPMSEGAMRLIHKDVWNLSTVLMQRERWFEVWKLCAARCPRDWLVAFCGVAMLTGSGDLRPLDNRRAQSMLVLGVLAWLMAEYDPAGDQSGGHFPWVIRGLPYGAYRSLLAYWEQYPGGAELHVPGSSTLFGTHAPGGRFERADCGYIAAWKQADIARTFQPNGFKAANGMAGKWRYPRKKAPNSTRRERWAFVEIRLRIAAPKGDQPQVMGPPLAPPPRGRGRPGPRRAPNDELDTIVDELERAAYAEPRAAVAASPSPPLSAPLPRIVEVQPAPQERSPGQSVTPSPAKPATLSAEEWHDILAARAAIEAVGKKPRPGQVAPSSPLYSRQALQAPRSDQPAPPETTAPAAVKRTALEAAEPDPRDMLEAVLNHPRIAAARREKAASRAGAPSATRSHGFASVQDDPDFLEALRKYAEAPQPPPRPPNKPPE